MMYSVNMLTETPIPAKCLRNNLGSLRGTRSVVEVAIAIGVTRMTIYNYESGDTAPTTESLRALLRLYGEPIVYLPEK